MKTECAAPAPATQKELVRLLYLEHGHQKASQLSGVNYDLVRKWASLGKWNDLHKPSQITIAANNVQADLAEHERKTKLGLASYASAQAEHLAKNGKLKDSGAFKNVAGGASIVHRWDAKSENTGNVIVNVALLGVQPTEVGVEAITVEPDIPS